MEHYLSILVRSIFIDNIALSMFLGMCTLSGAVEEDQCCFWSGYCGYCGTDHYCSG